MERAEFRTYYKQFIERFAAFIKKRTPVPFIVFTAKNWHIGRRDSSRAVGFPTASKVKN